MTSDYVLIRVAGRGPRNVYHELAANGTDALCGRPRQPDQFALRTRWYVTRQNWTRCEHCTAARRREWLDQRDQQATPAPRQPVAGEFKTCELDGVPIDQHPRCAVCSILIGPRHHARDVFMRGGRSLCSECARRHDKQERR